MTKVSISIVYASMVAWANFGWLDTNQTENDEIAAW
jgi:hypothetical protein